jgi:uncharacterized membrane protein YjjB (DUF3815 family)
LSSHALRTAVVYLGLDIVTGTLLGALAAGTLAALFARAYNAPPATFAFPGVLAMVPGYYAFRAFLGGIQIMHLGEQAPVRLIAETISLSIATIMMCAAIAIGVAMPLAFYRRTRRAVGQI